MEEITVNLTVLYHFPVASRDRDISQFRPGLRARPNDAPQSSGHQLSGRRIRLAGFRVHFDHHFYRYRIEIHRLSRPRDYHR